MKNNPQYYDTPRAKEKLSDYAIHEYGRDKAEKARPDLVEATKSADKLYDSYLEECKKVCDKILGDYGTTKLYECKYYSLSIRDTFGDMVSSLDRE